MEGIPLALKSPYNRCCRPALRLPVQRFDDAVHAHDPDFIDINEAASFLDALKSRLNDNNIARGLLSWI